jgi:hypothetical protein
MRWLPFLVLAAGCSASDDGIASVSSALQRDLLHEFDDAVLVIKTGSIAPPDASVIAAARRRVAEDPTSMRLVREVNRVMRASAAGHQFVATDDACKEVSHEFPKEFHSRFGVCGRPYRTGVVVTFARPGNRLGLVPGDWVRAVDAFEGPAMSDAVLNEIACGSSTLNACARAATAAASLFGTVAPGTNLTVQSRSGQERIVKVPHEADAAWTRCTDPWLADGPNVSVDERADGVVVLHIRRFRDPESGPEFLSQVRAGFARASAKALVVDLRGNQGGVLQFAEETLEALPGARTGTIATCSVRGESEHVTLGLSRATPTAAPSKVAVLVDGLAFSAGDVFPLLAQRLAGFPIVGAPTQGEINQGAVSDGVLIGGPIPLRVTASLSSCIDTQGVPLAGSGATMDQAVELNPSDVARGIDTQLEAAVRFVR